MYNNNGNVVYPNSIATVKKLFSRTSFLTLTSATGALSAFVILSTLAYSFGLQQNTVLKSLYYLFGNTNAGIFTVNLIMGIFTAVPLVILTFTLISAQRSADNNNDGGLRKSIDRMLFCCIYFIILASCIIIFALASVSVIYRESLLSAEYYYYSDYYYYSAYSALISYVFCGTTVICLLVSATRLVLSLRRAASNQPLTAKGSVLAIISGFVISAISIIIFIADLSKLITPYDSSLESGANTIGIDASELLILMSELLLIGAAAVCFITFTILTIVYSGFVSNSTKAASHQFVQPYAANIHNQPLNRPPYRNPAVNPNVNRIQSAPYPTRQVNISYTDNAPYAYRNNPPKNPVQQINPQQPVPQQPAQQVNTQQPVPQQPAQQVNTQQPAPQQHAQQENTQQPQPKHNAQQPITKQTKKAGKHPTDSSQKTRSAFKHSTSCSSTTSSTGKHSTACSSTKHSTAAPGAKAYSRRGGYRHQQQLRKIRFLKYKLK